MPDLVSIPICYFLGNFEHTHDHICFDPFVWVPDPSCEVCNVIKGNFTPQDVAKTSGDMIRILVACPMGAGRDEHTAACGFIFMKGVG